VNLNFIQAKSALNADEPFKPLIHAMKDYRTDESKTAPFLTLNTRGSSVVSLAFRRVIPKDSASRYPSTSGLMMVILWGAEVTNIAEPRLEVVLGSVIGIGEILTVS
jgi:hypothetical protein